MSTELDHIKTYQDLVLRMNPQKKYFETMEPGSLSGLFTDDELKLYKLVKLKEQ
jgi:hypothetical protein